MEQAAKNGAGLQISLGAAIDQENLELEQIDPRPLVINGRRFRSRIFVGTGKFASNQDMLSAVQASATEMVTVALRRVDLSKSVDEEDMISLLDREK